jgi:dTDP-4-amino-4,6-dideoxy-D-galactose acyltransferase
MEYEILEWDSTFFGFRVAKILSKSLSQQQLEKYLSELKKKQARLIYLAVPEDDELSNSSAIALNGLLVDRKITYQASLNELDVTGILNGVKTRIYSGPLNKELESLALLSGKFSRYNVDPDFPKELFAKLYIRWMINSLSKEIADVVMVAEENSRIIGMATVKKVTDEMAQLGIVAVAPEAEGHGIGSLIVKSTQEWARSHGCRYERVITQFANEGAKRLYNKCGFNQLMIENFYHFWL